MEVLLSSVSRDCTDGPGDSDGGKSRNLFVTISLALQFRGERGKLKTGVLGDWKESD